MKWAGNVARLREISDADSLVQIFAVKIRP